MLPEPNKQDLAEPALHAAARVGDVSLIRFLVAGGSAVDELHLVDQNRRFDTMVTPLMVAAGSESSSLEAVKALIELGADPHLSDGVNSALTYSCTSYNSQDQLIEIDRFKYLLSIGTPLPNDLKARNEMLAESASLGDCERVRLLLKAGVSAKGHWDRKAAAADMDNLVKLLKSRDEKFDRAGEQLLAGFAVAPSSYEIPLFEAASSGSVECVRMILSAGAEIAMRDNASRSAIFYADSEEVVRELISAGLSLDDSDSFGWNAFVNAVIEGNRKKINALIACGADVNSAHDNGFTVFMSAVSSETRSIRILRDLINAGANPHAVSEYGYNAFHAAIDVNGLANSPRSVKKTFYCLRQLGVDLELRNNADQTPLAKAIDRGSGLEVEILCEIGADPNAKCRLNFCDQNGCEMILRPLLFGAALGPGYQTAIKMRALLVSGADPILFDENGTPLLNLLIGQLYEDADMSGTLVDDFLSQMPSSTSRAALLEGFLAEFEPRMRKYVGSLASQVPVEKGSDFADQFRKDLVDRLVMLSCFSAWAKRER